MERFKKEIISVVLVALSSLMADANINWTVPDDPAALESFILLHKNMKKAEDSAAQELVAIGGIHIESKQITTAYNNSKRFLNERLADIGSIITLTLKITDIALKTKEAGEDYAEFMKTTYVNASKHPFLLFICGQVNQQLGEEMKQLVALSAVAVLMQTNVLPATMEEKVKFLDKISARLSGIQSILNSAKWKVRKFVYTGLQEYHIRELIESDVFKKVMSNTIVKWNQACQKSKN